MKNILFVTAYPDESMSVLKFLKNQKLVDKKFHSSQLNNHIIYHLETGIGFKNVQYALKKFFDLKIVLDLVFVVGFCGGLDDTLEVGQIVSPKSVLFLNQGLTLAGSETFALQTYPDMFEISQMVTVDKIIRTPKEKQDLFRETQASVVDMESGMISKLFQDHKVQTPISVVKAIIDSGEHELPQHMRNPLPEEKNLLVELKNNIKMAKERLEKDFLESYFDHLEP